MRRPFNWIVVCLSMLFLAANLPFDREPDAAWQTIRPALAENKFADIQFGYVRTDGSFQPLDKQDEVPAAADVGTAVYEWSSTISF